MRTFTGKEEKEAFSQGARCGHGDGWGRAGSYVLGEEVELSAEAYENGNTEYFGDLLRLAWLGGYQIGYRIAAEGEPLPVEYQYLVERKPRSWA